MVRISGYIADGAMAFLRKQYSAIAIFVVVVFFLLDWPFLIIPGRPLFVFWSGHFALQVQGLLV